MAGRGPAPKPDEQRQRQNPTVAMTDLAEPTVKAPPLPNARAMLPATRRWYKVWCGSVQASQFIATDWLTLHMLAEIVDAFHRATEPLVKKQLLGEIRLQQQKLGGTPEDRLRLRWRMREPGGEPEAELKPQRRSSRSRRDPRLELLEGGGQ